MTFPIRLELPMEPAAGSVNIYLFLTPEPILIDAGYNTPAAWDLLQGGLAAHGLTVADLTRVIITHPHVDHYGLAAQIVRAGQAEVWMSEVGVHWLQAFPTHQQRQIDYYRAEFLPRLGLPLDAVQAFLQWMEGTLAAWEPIAPERIVSFGLDQPLMLGGLPWQVLHLTGHDNQLTAFYQPTTRQLLSADALIIPTATPVVEAPPPGAARQPALPRMMDSLHRLAALDVETVYPGHGAPFGDHRTVIAGQLARIEARANECLTYIQAGASTVADLFARLYTGRITIPSPAGLWMTVGYLDLLVAQGRVTMQEEQGLWHYRARG
jgi:glyoxylase-like metal-dependent hydrolase (beta-lactamase superfamily II)